MIKKRILTGTLMAIIWMPIYLFFPPEFLFLLTWVLGYGMYVESYAMTFGKKNAFFFGAMPMVFQVVLVLIASILMSEELSSVFFGFGFIVAYSELIFWLCPIVTLLWGIRVFIMTCLKKPLLMPGGLYVCQLLDITLFIGSLSLSYLLNKYLLLYTMVLVSGIDVFSFFVGNYFGKHHIVPTVSPKKTLEGFLGGLIWVFLYGSIIMIPKEMSILALTLFLIMVYILAITGDLLVSYQKRLLDIKDSGTLLPGHGGLLDRFDSWIFVSAFVYYLVIIN